VTGHHQLFVVADVSQDPERELGATARAVMIEDVVIDRRGHRVHVDDVGPQQRQDGAAALWPRRWSAGVGW
jgi:hypothetical protein